MIWQGMLELTLGRNASKYHYTVLDDTIYTEDGKVISHEVTSRYQHHLSDSEESRHKSEYQKSSIDSTEHLLLSNETSATKTELTKLLDSASTQKPANIKGVALWNYEPNHVTDLRVQKGERVTVLHRSGEWAFVENESQKQGYIPVRYCSLIRRRSSSLTELSSELLRKIAYTKDEYTDRVTTKYYRHRNAFTPEPGRRYNGEDLTDLRRAKSTEKVPSKGTYNARKYENRMSNKKAERGLFSLAARKLRNAFKTSTGNKTRKEGANKASTNGGKVMPNWLEGFDNNNPEYSSSSESSDDEGYETRRRVHSYSNMYWAQNFNEQEMDRADRFNGYNTPHHRTTHQTNPASRLYPAVRNPSSLDSDRSSSELTTGFATVRKLKTASSTLELGQNGHKKVSLVRSSSFTHGERPRSLNLRLKPVDLIEEDESDEAFSESSFQWEAVNASLDPPDGKAEARQNCNDMFVIKDFMTQDEKDLNVVRGQKVYVLNKSNKNWWLVESEDGKGGFVPSDILMSERNAAEIVCEQPHGYKMDMSQDLRGRDKSNMTNIKLARISPTIRENNSLREEDDEMYHKDNIMDIKQEMRAQIYEFERQEAKKAELKKNESEGKTSELRESKTLKMNIKENLGQQSEGYTEPCNIYITSNRKDESKVSENSNSVNAVKEAELPSYEQLMEERKDNTTSNLGPSLVMQKIVTSQDCESNLIEVLMAEFKEEQKKIGNETTLSPRDLTTAETASACDSSSQTSYDSTEPIPRVLRRRNSMNKKVRFQTPECTSSKSSEGNDSNCAKYKDRTLATWL